MKSTCCRTGPMASCARKASHHRAPRPQQLRALAASNRAALQDTSAKKGNGLSLSGDLSPDVGGLGQTGGAAAGRATGCGGDAAMTFCDFSSGLPYTNRCSPLGRLGCADAHEGQHRHDIRPCCKRAPTFVALHGLAAARAAYNAWITVNSHWFECRAARSGLDCANRQAAGLNCAANPGNPLCQLIALQQGVVATHCPQVRNPYGPKPVPCPF